MKYNSIGEYFYRLSNRCLGLVILPVLVILFAYLGNQYFYTGLPLLKPKEETLYKFFAVEALGVIVLLGVSVGMVSGRLKALKMAPSLSNRMAGYVSIALIRFRFFSLMLLAIGVGIFLTGEIFILSLLPLPSLLILIYWPLGSRISKDLKLKPEEREILKRKLLGA